MTRRCVACAAMLVTLGHGALAQDTVRIPSPSAVLRTTFTRVDDIRELSDRRILIIDGRDKRMVVADFRSNRVVDVGRSGDGPSEYRAPTQLVGFAPGSTFVIDFRSRRWLLLSEATIVGTIGASTAPRIVAFNAPIRGVDSNRRVAHMLGFPSSIPTPLTGGTSNTDAIGLAVTSLAASATDTIARLRGRLLGRNEVAKVTPEGAFEIALNNPFGTEDQAWLFPDGWIVVVRVSPYSAEWISPDGRRRGGEPIPFEQIRVTDSERELAIELSMGEQYAPYYTADEFPNWPSTVPPIPNDALLPLRDGRIVVERRQTAESTARTYDVLNRQGARDVVLSIPLSGHIVAFGDGTVYIVTIDEDGLHHVARHPLPTF